MAGDKQSDYQALRRRCGKLRQAGWLQAAIAQAFGLTQPCPELNPVELVWSQLKSNLKNRVFTSLDELAIAVLDQTKRLGNDPQLVRAFFNKKKWDLL